MDEPRQIANTERRGIIRRENDLRHQENQARFMALEGTQAEILSKLEDLAGLGEFLRDAKVGIKWSGKFGKFIGKIARFLEPFVKLAGYALAAYGAWRGLDHLK